MITTKQLTSFNVNLSVIPISNDLNKHPIRAIWSPKNKLFLIKFDTHILRGYKRRDIFFDLVSPCPVCHNGNLYRHSPLQSISITSNLLSYRYERYANVGVIALMDAPYYLYSSHKTRVLKINNQSYLVTCHDDCYEKYKLSPLGYDLESNPLK